MHTAGSFLWPQFLPHIYFFFVRLNENYVKIDIRDDITRAGPHSGKTYSYKQPELLLLAIGTTTSKNM